MTSAADWAGEDRPRQSRAGEVPIIILSVGNYHYSNLYSTEVSKYDSGGGGVAGEAGEGVTGKAGGGRQRPREGVRERDVKEEPWCGRMEKVMIRKSEA